MNHNKSIQIPKPRQYFNSLAEEVKYVINYILGPTFTSCKTPRGSKIVELYYDHPDREKLLGYYEIDYGWYVRGLSFQHDRTWVGGEIIDNRFLVNCTKHYKS